jgi:hypothetical protein
MQYIIKGGFSTVDEAVWVKKNKSILAYPVAVIWDRDLQQPFGH